MRRLWKGEVVFGHDGPAGKFPVLHLDASFDEDIPLGFVAFGPNSLALAGRCFDAVVLHTFFTDETVERCVATVRRAAEAAGRDPASVRIWSCYATIGDHLPEALRLKKTVGRLATYLQGYGDLLVETNGWDPDGAGALPRRRGGVDVSRRARHARPTPRRSSTSPRCCPTSGSSPPPPATPRTVRGARAAPVRPRRRRRDHARRDARPSSRRSSPRTARSGPAGRSTAGPRTRAGPGRVDGRPPQADGRDHRRGRGRDRDGRRAASARATTSRSTRSPTAWAARGATTPIPAPRATCRRTCTRSRSS